MFTSWRNLGMPSVIIIWLNFPPNCCETSLPHLHFSSLPSPCQSRMVTPGNLWSPFRPCVDPFLFSRSILIRPWERILWLHLDLHTSERTSVLSQDCSFAVIPTCFYNFGQFCAFVPQFFHLLSGGADAGELPHRNAMGEKHGWLCFQCLEVSRRMILPSFKGLVMKDTTLFYVCILLTNLRTQLSWKKLPPSCLISKHDTNDLGKYQWIPLPSRRWCTGHRVFPFLPNTCKWRKTGPFCLDTISQKPLTERQLPKALFGVHMISFAFWFLWFNWRHRLSLPNIPSLPRDAR